MNADCKVLSRSKRPINAQGLRDKEYGRNMNDKEPIDLVPIRIRALAVGAQAIGSLAVGAIALRTLAVGVVAIGRLAVGIKRIQGRRGFGRRRNTRSKRNGESVVQHGIRAAFGGHIVNEENLPIGRICYCASPATIVSKTTVSGGVAAILNPQVVWGVRFSGIGTVSYCHDASRKVAARNSAAWG